MINNDNYDDISSVFTCEQNAKFFLEKIRWSNGVICPKCGGKKYYNIDSNKKFKCANNKCYYKFSLTSNTLIACTNLSLITWIKVVYIFLSKKGAIDPIDISVGAAVAEKSSILIFSRLELAWKHTNKTLKKFDLFKEFFYQLFTLYEKREEIQCNKWGHIYHVSNIDDISNPYQFNRLMVYCRVRLYYCTWIHKNVLQPCDILSEVFLYLYDNKIDVYDADFIIRIINRVISRMWYRYTKENPLIMKRRRERASQLTKEHRISISQTYLIRIAKQKTGLTKSELLKNTEIIKKIKESIIEKRKSNGELYEENYRSLIIPIPKGGYIIKEN